MAWRIHRGLRRALVPPGLNSSPTILCPPAASSFSFSSLQSRSQAIAAPESGSGGSISRKTGSFRSSLNPTEVAKFAAIAETWWDSQGPFKPLHLMNPTRVSFIRATLCHHFRKDPLSVKPLEGLKIIDVGCGGGILAEALDPLTSSIEYHCTTAEELVKENKKFDAVISLEVIEHVADPADFCKSLAALTVPNGATIISTINRSMRSYATAIVAAEYLLNWLPKGTHQWSRFLIPEELVLILERAGISVEEMAGFIYNPLTGDWTLSDDTSVNFIAFGTKRNE